MKYLLLLVLLSLKPALTSLAQTQSVPISETLTYHCFVETDAGNYSGVPYPTQEEPLVLEVSTDPRDYSERTELAEITSIDFDSNRNANHDMFARISVIGSSLVLYVKTIGRRHRGAMATVEVSVGTPQVKAKSGHQTGVQPMGPRDLVGDLARDPVIGIEASVECVLQ